MVITFLTTLLIYVTPNRKTASLGEMIQQLGGLGVAVPGGFAVTVEAYDAILDRFSLRQRLKLLLDGVDGTFIPDVTEKTYAMLISHNVSSLNLLSSYGFGRS